MFGYICPYFLKHVAILKGGGRRSRRGSASAGMCRRPVRRSLRRSPPAQKHNNAWSLRTPPEVFLPKPASRPSSEIPLRKKIEQARRGARLLLVSWQPDLSRPTAKPLRRGGRPEEGSRFPGQTKRRQQPAINADPAADTPCKAQE